MAWDLQETYLNGLSDDPEVPFNASTPTGAGQATPGVTGPVVRENVDTGAKILDIRGMIAELDRDPGARKRT